MFCFIKFSKDKGENLYDIRFPINLKDKYLKENKLYYKFLEKKIYIKDVVITINENGIDYNHENDKDILLDKEFIIREYETIPCTCFNFYNSDSEESYRLYENNDGSIKLKEFSDYFTFEMISENKDLKIKK
jgi:hypothetical protein